MYCNLDTAKIDITRSFESEYNNSPQFEIYKENMYMSSVPRHCVPKQIPAAMRDGTETRSNQSPMCHQLHHIILLYTIECNPKLIIQFIRFRNDMSNKSDFASRNNNIHHGQPWVILRVIALHKVGYYCWLVTRVTCVGQI